MWKLEVYKGHINCSCESTNNTNTFETYLLLFWRNLDKISQSCEVIVSLFPVFFLRKVIVDGAKYIDSAGRQEKQRPLVGSLDHVTL